MVDAEHNRLREKGCQHLSKLESEEVEEIYLYNEWSTTGRDGWMKVIIGWAPGEEVPGSKG